MKTKPPQPCKYCGIAGTHLEFACFQKPRKSMRATTTIKTKKPMNKIGPVAKKWIVTKKRWLEANKAAYYFCHYCNVMMTRTQLTLDHKESRSRKPELRFVLSNLVPCCYSCNGLKGSRSHDEFCARCVS